MKKLGTILSVEHGVQYVECDDGQTMHLTPHWNAVKGCKVGDRIELEYVATSSRGMWRGKIIKAEEPKS
jgi:hypothetical protein